MSKKENNQEFSLEDIMKEFGASPVEAEESLSDADMEELAGQVGMSLDDLTSGVEIPQIPPVEEPEEMQKAEADGETPEQEAPAPREVTDDTIRIDDLSEVAAAAVMTAASPVEENEQAQSLGDTVRLDTLPEHLASSDSGASAPEKQEEEIVVPPPIILHPRSRLRELKKKLVAGPEKRYYDLTEIGLGRLQIAIIVNILVVLLCVGSTAMFAMGMIPGNRLKLMVFSQVLAMMISALLGCYLLMDTIAEALKGKFTLNTLLLVTLIACIVDAVFCLRQQRVPCCAAFSLEMTMALWNRYLKRQTEMGQMDTMRKAVRLDSVVKVDDYFEGRPGILRGQGEVEDFMDQYQETSGPEKAQNLFAFISLLVCIAIAVMCGLRHGIALACQIFATSLLVAVPASFFVSLSRPMATLERRLHMVGTVLCGWQGVKGLCGAATFPLWDADLFPIGASKLNGVKFYGDRTPDEIISYASALIQAHDSGLTPVFTQLRKSRNCIEYSADNLQNYGDGGIGGEVQGEPVLMGTLNFLQDMGVEIPEGTMVNQAIYCAIDGQLSAVFAIAYAKMKSATAGLITLCGYRRLTPVVICGDFMLNESFLRSKFGINTRRIAFPSWEVRRELRSRPVDSEATAYALTTQEGLASVAYAVTGARAVRTASRVGLVIHLLGGIIGMLIMLALAYLGTADLLTPVNVLLYQLVWMIPGLLVTEWTRTV